MSTHIQRMARAIAVAKAYRERHNDLSERRATGYVTLHRLKAVGWTLELDTPDHWRPGTLFVAIDGAVSMATGGDAKNGANEFSSVWDPAPKQETPKIVLTQPDYFEDDQPCGYCQRPIGTPHKPWCRQ